MTKVVRPVNGPREKVHPQDKALLAVILIRAAQMMASEYKKRGGGYTTDKKDKDESQKHLDNWTEEEWQTKDGGEHAKKDDGTEQRYLPKKAWEEMSSREITIISDSREYKPVCLRLLDRE